MRTFLARRFIPMLAIGAAGALGTACGSDDASPGNTVVVADDAAVLPPSGSQVPVLSSDIPLETLPPYDSSDIPLIPPPVDSTDLPIIITVTVGVDSAEDRIDNVPLGATVSLTVVNPTADDEFHLHGFDLGDGQPVPAGQAQTFTFSASRPGQFELESHTTDQVLSNLAVA